MKQKPFKEENKNRKSKLKKNGIWLQRGRLLAFVKMGLRFV